MTASPNESFAARRSVEQVEEGEDLAPRFDDNGLLPVVTTDAASGEVLMLGYMNAEALEKSIETGEAHYYSRSRQKLWRKGATSGLVQKIVDMRIDDDQDAVWLAVEVAGSGASCHVGYRSCFYRSIPVGRKPTPDLRLRYREDEKTLIPWKFTATRQIRPGCDRVGTQGKHNASDLHHEDTGPTRSSTLNATDSSSVQRDANKKVPPDPDMGFAVKACRGSPGRG